MVTDLDALLPSILKTLRGTLHASAEASGAEMITSSIISTFLSSYGPDRVLTDLGGHGVAAVYEGAAPGPTVLVRAELDAVTLPVAAEHDGETPVAHVCGHDGHMSMVAGLAPLLQRRRPACGRVVLLFQPSEETGYGAQLVIDDPQFLSIRPDYAFALHNIPGAPLGSVVYRRNAFSCASTGMRVDFYGATSHAAEPEKARNPAGALAKLLAELPFLSDMSATPSRMLTITHLALGHENYGLTPGQAVLCATLRSETGAGLEDLRQAVQRAVHDATDQGGLKSDVSWLEPFPAVANSEVLVERLLQTCKTEGIETIEAAEPFRWSEDFGHMAQVCPMLFFGIGIGENAPALHRPDYAFPDQVMEVGVRCFAGLLRQLTSGEHAAMA